MASKRNQPPLQRGDPLSVSRLPRTGGLVAASGSGGDDGHAVMAAWNVEIERCLNEVDTGTVEWVSHKQVMQAVRAAIVRAVRERD
jgi:hypothetical protein